jgi:hypothetical protein
MAKPSFIQDVESYVAIFNQADWESIRNQVLDENVKVYVDGTLVAEGRDQLEASYRADFGRNRRVKIVGPARVVETEGAAARDEAAVRVTLLAHDGSSSSSSAEPSSSTTTTQVDVIYTYDAQSRKQVRHEIFLEPSQLSR